ncbi:hypothetical protein K239x_56160 [Planctomycetes bacterium K23_9]|uniref:Uncharacterized protein n=1 Tax=Stieleria marina TaxID=1930275 RepID=A0A517P2J9_9BACT|nr:hypothetical protein K239x_56160 [Planctomycetes bacterium K23_9]
MDDQDSSKHSLLWDASLNRLTARIALIAYLMGGWLLPMTHQHGDGCGHAGHWFAEITATQAWHLAGHQHAPDSSPSGDSHTHHGCSHDHSHPCASAESIIKILRAAGGKQVLREGASSPTQGLCALCVARTLSSSNPASAPHSAFSDCVVFLPRLASVASPLSVLSCGNGPRGPPAIG